MASESKYGFKDKKTAEESLKLLESEDFQYQKLTVRGLLGRAKRVLTSKFIFIVMMMTVDGYRMTLKMFVMMA